MPRLNAETERNEGDIHVRLGPNRTIYVGVVNEKGALFERMSDILLECINDMHNK